MDRTLEIAGVVVPRMLYGTAWKEEATQGLTRLALEQGFRGIDTANQRRHYDEASVGRAISAAISSGLVARDDLFVQTKYTFQHGQDHRLPYNPAAPIAVQVQESFASSLEHLQLERIDSYVLHGPTSSSGISADDWEAWRAMERIYESGRARLLGVSNVSLAQLQTLCQGAKVQPHFVQNRCYAVSGWDRSIREFCKAHRVLYQGFSLLTANRAFLSTTALAKLAERHQMSVEQLVFRFSIEAGMIPLTGTSDRKHMQSDLEIFDARLEPAEYQLIENIASLPRS